MRGRRARTAIAALFGVSIVGSLVGCSVAPSMSAHALAEAQAAIRARNTHKTSNPTDAATVTPVDVSSPTPTPAASTASTKAKSTPKSTPSPQPTKKSSPSPSPTPTPTPTLLYTDGTYSATGSYTSPGGNETLRATITIANDIVQSVSVHSVHVDSTARQYEAMFASGISAVVVGKDLSTLNVGAVGGSSLTCVGFNAAVVTIRSEAAS